MLVKDHSKFALFQYQNFVNPNFELGAVLFKANDEVNPIGIVIQLHADGDCRTDMYGNVSTEEVRLATYKEVKKYRPDILSEIN